MENKERLIRSVIPLLGWYAENKRELPWRRDQDPYHIWVSEIMLQQTRVEAVIPYYERFLRVLPDISALAACPEDQLLKLWEGLGYYSRARNMKTAAMEIMEKHGGQMPETFEEIKGLKGIGPYTAGAISSIAFGNPTPAVDGNVLRVITRLTADDSDILSGKTKTKIESMLKEIYPEDHAGDFTQALMELGAMVCIPNGEPLCDQCPWQKLCLCREQELWKSIPVKTKKMKRRIEERTILVIRKDDLVLLEKRPDTGLLAGLYEFPNLPGYLSGDEILLELEKRNITPLSITPLSDAKHIFSHIEWHMKGFLIEAQSGGKHFVKGTDYAIPSAFEVYKKAMK